MSGIRPVDSARAARMVMAQLTGDELMFATAVQETFADDYTIGLLELGSAINVLRSMSADLAGALADIHGTDNAEQLVQVLLARLRENDTPTT